jgi:hypothetical protein
VILHLRVLDVRYAAPQVQDHRQDGTVIEVLYFAGCPNRAPFVARLAELLAELGVTEPVREIAVESPAGAEEHRFLGSPTLRIDGRDIDPAAATRTDYALACRLYPGGFPAEWVRAALRNRTEPAP